MRKLLLLGLLVWNSINIFGQLRTDFVCHYATEDDDSIVNGIEDSKGDFILVGTHSIKDTNPYKFNGLILRISPKGDTLSRVVTIPDTSLQLYQLVQQDNGYMIVGAIGLNDQRYNEDHILLLKIDTALNTIWRKKYRLPEPYKSFSHTVVLPEANGDFVIAGHVRDQNHVPSAMLCRFTAEGDSLTSRVFPHTQDGGEVNDLCYNADSSQYWLFGPAWSGSSPIQRVELDTNFTINRIDLLPFKISEHISTNWLGDGSLFCVGHQMREYTKDDFDEILLTKLDTSLNILQEALSGTRDTNDYPAWCNALDFVQNDKIFYTGTHNKGMTLWAQHPSWIVAGCTDSNISSLNEVYYGGDAYYNTSSVIATRDGGCLVTASRYDYQLPEFHARDIIAIKFSPEEFVGIQHSNQKHALTTAIVYPNPGTNELNIRTTLKDARFTLFDQAGKVVLNEPIYSKTTNLSTSPLPAGSYSYIISSAESNETGIWIKNQLN